MTKAMLIMLTIGLTLLSSLKISAQDSAVILFNKKFIKLPENGNVRAEALRSDSTRETLIEIEANKYFYIKHDLKDTSAIEFGQLELFKFRDGFYLLRDGLWVIENETEKILFYNLGNKGWKEESRVHLEPIIFDSSKQNKTKKVRTRSAQ